MAQQLKGGNASAGRVYNAYAGGKDNSEADRALAGEAAIKDMFTSRVTLLPPPGTAAGRLGDPRLWLPFLVRQDSSVSLRAGIGIVTRLAGRAEG